MNTGKWFRKNALQNGFWFIALVLFLTTLLSSGVATATFGDVVLVSSDNEGVVGNNASQSSDVSADGRYVVFHSLASNLILGDNNDTFDVFLKDAQTQQIWLVSTSLGGAGPANGPSFEPSVSADGRYVLFTSYASDIVANDTNNNPDMFVWDKTTQENIRVSVAWDGGEGNGSADGGDLSGDGVWVVFTSDSENLIPGDSNGKIDIYLRDLETWELFRLTPSLGVEANGNSFEPVINLDGTKVAFSSTASNWVATGAWSGHEDVYLHDVGLGQTSYVVRSTTDGPGNNSSSDPKISPNGRYVAFQSYASNLSTIDTNNFSDVFVLDTITDELSLVSVDRFGQASNNNSGLFGLDVIDTGWVTFESKASDLVATTAGILSRVYFRSFEHTQLLVGGDPGENTQYPATAGSSYMVFESQIPDLVAGDSNGTWDVFLFDLASPTPTPTNTPTSTPTATPQPPFGSKFYLPFVVND